MFGHGKPRGLLPRAVFDVIRQGKVKVEVRHSYPLAEAERVHRDLEGRRTIGSIVMIP